MNENKSLMISRYIFGAGVLLQLLCFASISLLKEWVWHLFFIAYLLMVCGVYSNLKAKGLQPFKKTKFYVAALLLLWPVIGLLIAIGIIFRTPEQGVRAAAVEGVHRDKNKELKMSRYIFGGGILLQILLFVALFLLEQSDFSLGEFGIILTFTLPCGLMVYGLYANLKTKGLQPLEEIRFYATAFIILWPIMGPLIAMGIMYGTPDQGMPAPRWRTVLFSPWMIALALIIFLGPIAIQGFFAFRVKSAQFHLKEAKQHIAAAREGGKRGDIRRELAEAASNLAGVRRLALTDANTGWYLKWFLSESIIKESELVALEQEITLEMKNNPGRK